MRKYCAQYLLSLCVALCTLFAADLMADNFKDRHDLLDLISGATALSQSSEFGGKWTALLLLDGTTSYGWASKPNAPFPHNFVLELANTASLDSLVIDNREVEESAYPGISARNIEIWVSTQGPDSGYKKAMVIEAAQHQRKLFKFPQPTEVRWLKLVVTSNYGHPDYTEMMELEAYGKFIENIDSPDFSGVFNTNYNLMLFKQQGNQVRGCYDWDGGTLTGTTDGRTVQFEWREDEGTDIGTAVMVLASDGVAINGIWYKDGAYGNYWRGDRVKDGRKPICTMKNDNAIGNSLQESGRAITYGILFDLDSDKLKPESDTTLQQVLQVMSDNLNLNLAIEGHTDSSGDTAHNLDLSQRRATAVVKWLVEQGVSRQRLQAHGLGERMPVADNRSRQGRSLNRRVELKKR